MLVCPHRITICAFFSWKNDAVFESSLETATSVFIKQWITTRFVAYGRNHCLSS